MLSENTARDLLTSHSSRPYLTFPSRPLTKDTLLSFSTFHLPSLYIFSWDNLPWTVHDLILRKGCSSTQTVTAFMARKLRRLMQEELGGSQQCDSETTMTEAGSTLNKPPSQGASHSEKAETMPTLSIQCDFMCLSLDICRKTVQSLKPYLLGHHPKQVTGLV